MSNTETELRPVIYAVTTRPDKKSIWTRIGLLFPHKDGQGFNPVYFALPCEGASIVIRYPLKSTGNAGAEMTKRRKAA